MRTVILTRLIDEHLAQHPAMDLRDVYKLLYQGVLGLEHLISSPEDFAAGLRPEYETATPYAAEPLWEPIRPDGALMRLNLRPFKARGGDVGRLVATCLRTARQAWGTPDELRTTWATFVKLCQAGKWKTFLLTKVLSLSAWLEENGYPPAHHSSGYREASKPAYRLVCNKFLSHLKIQEVKDV